MTPESRAAAAGCLCGHVASVHTKAGGCAVKTCGCGVYSTSKQVRLEWNKDHPAYRAGAAQERERWVEWLASLKGEHYTVIAEAVYARLAQPTEDDDERD
jgi:hypothetical protein